MKSTSFDDKNRLMRQSPRLARACGRVNASELLFTGQAWSAQRGVAAGLANALFPAEEFGEASNKLVAAICANSLEANLVLKHALSAAETREPQALELAEAEFDALFSGPDFQEGRDAFLQKRKAIFPSHHR